MAVQIKERPIIFNARDARAILDGKKTQTRRVMKLKVGRDNRFDVPDRSYAMNINDHRALAFCPLGQTGDRLWVREAWRIGAWDEDNGAFAIDYIDGPDHTWRTEPTDTDGARFNRLWTQCCDELEAKGVKAGADGNYHWAPGESPLRWRRSINMPRWASRILLEITEVRVENLQAISEEDAQAEGAVIGEYYAGASREPATHRDVFSNLWDVSAPFGARWSDNPWVWAVSFKRVEA